MKIAFDRSGWDDYQFWATTDPQVLKRINKLILEITRDPRGGIGKPEPLRGFSLEVWSRRIMLEHRLVYVIEEDLITIASCRYHY